MHVTKIVYTWYKGRGSLDGNTGVTVESKVHGGLDVMIGGSIKQIRQNHALEHATVSILLEAGVRPPLGGYSTSRGFFIFGRCSADAINDAVQEAHTRLTAGQSEMAISPYCGTNLATGALLSGLIAAIIMRYSSTRHRKVSAAIFAAAGSALISRPLGKMIQRKFTTLADINDLAVIDIRQFLRRPYPVFRIRTQGSPHIT